jgi:hypothetical protein
VTFQYGTTPALGLKASAGTLAASGDPSTVTAKLSGLPLNRVIYYRVSATNGFGTNNGAVRTFRTTGQVTSVSFGNQLITLTTPLPAHCLARTNRLSATLSSTAIRKSTAPKLRFVRAVFYIDRGVRHTHKKTKRLRNGHKKTVIVVTYTANATVLRLPTTQALRLTGLGSRTHTLKVTLSYTKIVIRHRHRKTVTVTKTLSVRFRVC